jgi:signal peptidase I
MTKKDLSDLIKYFFIALLITIPIKLYVAQPFVVSGESMLPSFEDGEYLVIDELSYYLREPERGEVVIFRYPLDTSKYFIKRIIGLPGEKVEIIGSIVSIITKDGEKITIEESYISEPDNRNFDVLLSDNEYFVMGDNRPASSDSRIWGPVKENLIIGRVYLRVLPINEFEILPGAVNR